MPRFDALGRTKPKTVFDRDAEWDALTAFTSDSSPGARLGLVSGRFRQGKSFLLQTLAEAVGGFYFAAQEAAEVESLRRLGEELAHYTGASRTARWRGWEDAVDALLALGDRRPVLIVLDEFSHLVRQSSGLPSAISRAYRRLHETKPDNRCRMLLCGSPLPLVRRLFSEHSPLREHATLELAVRPLNFRQAAEFWKIDDPRLAVLVHAVVGGSPAYRCAYAGDDTPSDAGDFDAWICRTVLNPRIPLFHEADHLLQEETDHWNRDLTHSVFGAITLGYATEGEISRYLGASLAEVSRCVTVCKDRELLQVDPDALQPKTHRLHIAEPLLAFEHAITRPHRSVLEQTAATDVWLRAGSVFELSVMAPHFAQICRDWVVQFAAPATFGAAPASAFHGSLPQVEGHTDLDAEVVVRGKCTDGAGPLLSVGLARWNEIMDLHHLDRIRTLLSLLAARGEDVDKTLPACYSTSGFSPALRAAEAQGDVVLIDIDRLYSGQ